MNKLTRLALVLAGCASLWPLASATADTASEDRRSVVLHNVNLHPRDREGSRILLQRVDDAAMEACGASDDSLRELRGAVRASQCWKQATADTVRRIDDPLVSEAYREQR